jgi:integrase
MARKKDLCQDAKGRFVRNLGWKRTATGYSQQKFYLGTDEHQAKLASLRLERLWNQIAARFKSERKPPGEENVKPAQIAEVSPGLFQGRIRYVEVLGVPAANQFQELPDRPLWDAVTLTLAEAIRRGESTVRIPLAADLRPFLPESSIVGDWLRQLQRDFEGIRIELDDAAVNAIAQDSTKDEGQRLIALGQQMLRSRVDPARLHQSLAAYSRWISGRFVRKDQRTTAWGSLQSRIVAFLQQHVEDMPLAELETARIEAIVELLQSRPAGKRGRPVSAAWTTTCIKLFRRFLRWLHKSPDFAWRRPADLELQAVRIVESSEERSKKRRTAQVQTYTAEELKECWARADPFMRLLMLLALNCGFGRGELASLELDEVLLRAKHPHERDLGIATTSNDGWILRIRRKSSIYGEWKLWPETTAALEAWLAERQQLGVPASERALLVNRRGRRFDEPTRGNHTNFQIPNRWYALIDRIRRKTPGFRKLSFNKLRKTASNWIRREAGGEIASIFLAHGKAVASDDLLDVYTNRPFAKVFAAIDRVGELMRSTGVFSGESLATEVRSVSDGRST